MFSYFLNNIFQATTYINIILILINFFQVIFFFQWMVVELKSIEKNNLDHVEHETVERDMDARGLELVL